MSSENTIIIYKPAKSEVPLKYFDKLFESNNFMSYGILANVNNKLDWLNNETDFFEKEDFLADYNEYKDEQLVISLSESFPYVQKELDDFNPYFINKKIGYCISFENIYMTSLNQKYFSDELNFREALRNISDFWYIDKFEDALLSIEESLKECKIVFLDVAGDVSIFNEELGTWKNNVWYSEYIFAKEENSFSFKDEYDDYMNSKTSYEVCDSCRAFDLDVMYNQSIGLWLCSDCEKQLCSDLSDF